MSEPASDAEPTPADAGADGDPPPENEVLREVRRVRELAENAVGKVGWKTAAGIGVGSAALIAALLYAGRNKRD